VLTAARYTRCLLELSWPMDNFGPSLPNLMATIAGNLFELRQVSGLRLLDLAVPESFAAACPGPAFGIEGTRRLAGVPPARSSAPSSSPAWGCRRRDGATVRQLLAGGIDFIKDDELQADGPHCPFDERVRAVMREVHEAAQRSGAPGDGGLQPHRRGRRDARRHDLVLSLGGTCVMVSLNSVGLAGTAGACAATRSCPSTRTATAGAP
jgi:ribulose-bisphosphate carboxylase large chain